MDVFFLGGGARKKLFSTIGKVKQMSTWESTCCCYLASSEKKDIVRGKECFTTGQCGTWRESKRRKPSAWLCVISVPAGRRLLTCHVIARLFSTVLLKLTCRLVGARVTSRHCLSCPHATLGQRPKNTLKITHTTHCGMYTLNWCLLQEPLWATMREERTTKW